MCTKKIWTVAVLKKLRFVIVLLTDNRLIFTVRAARFKSNSIKYRLLQIYVFYFINWFIILFRFCCWILYFLFLRVIWLILTSFCIIEDDRLQILFILQGDLADSDLVGTNRRRKAADIVYFSSWSSWFWPRGAY